MWRKFDFNASIVFDFGENVYDVQRFFVCYFVKAKALLWIIYALIVFDGYRILYG